MTEQPHGPNKSSVNLLAYFGARKFHAGFFAAYVGGAVIVAVLANLIFGGGSMPVYLWWTSIVVGVLVGTGLYFWDLRKAKQKF